MPSHPVYINSKVYSFINEFVSGVDKQHHRAFAARVAGGAWDHPTAIVSTGYNCFNAIIDIFSTIRCPMFIFTEGHLIAQLVHFQN